ncbi:hypothetical protein C8J56DRAFT_26591 [Mycena floridula]|nr:hypothetical protein C8J56DRAFT_26591 [Mycena floridula]
MQLNKFSIAASAAERRETLVSALNISLESFRYRQFDPKLPDSTDLVFSVHPLGIVGARSDVSKRGAKISEENILNLWEVNFSHQISSTKLPIIAEPEPSELRRRTAFPSSQSTASSSRKHRLENTTSRRKISLPLPKFAEQSSLYAEKRLRAEPFMNHAIRLVVQDAQLSLRWHNRESTPQSFPIDLISEPVHSSYL